MDGAAEPDEPGYGPLRAWPGGLCVSRAIGDMDVGECIIAHPHIMQIQIPQEGARLVMASDGLWDCFPTRKVVKMARTKDTQQAGTHGMMLLHPSMTPVATPPSVHNPPAQPCPANSLAAARCEICNCVMQADLEAYTIASCTA